MKVTIHSNRLRQLAKQWQEFRADSLNADSAVVSLSAPQCELCASQWYVDVGGTRHDFAWLGGVCDPLLSTDEKAFQKSLAITFNQLKINRPWPLSRHLPWREVESFLRDRNDQPAVSFDSLPLAVSPADAWFQWMKVVESHLWCARARWVLSKIESDLTRFLGQGRELAGRVKVWQLIFETIRADPLLALWGTPKIRLKAIDENWVVLGSLEGKKLNLADFEPGSWGNLLLEKIPGIMPQAMKSESGRKIVAEVVSN